jgi:hypothetical protein
MRVNSSRVKESEESLSIRSIVVASTEQISSDLAGEAVILDLKTGVYYGLDPVGARIWKLLQEPRVVSEVRDVLLAEYDITPDRCESDLLSFLSDLMAKGLVEMRSQSVR